MTHPPHPAIRAAKKARIYSGGQDLPMVPGKVELQEFEYRRSCSART
jgi:hypothetical protein